MKKIKRKKIQREWLENQLGKYERRIQKLAEQAYYVRQAISLLDQQESARNKEKGEISNAICESGVEAAASAGQTDPNAGESNISNPTTPEEILG
jgi:hypothetical protein